jgi:hypothetical protein
MAALNRIEYSILMLWQICHDETDNYGDVIP